MPFKCNKKGALPGGQRAAKGGLRPKGTSWPKSHKENRGGGVDLTRLERLQRHIW